MPYFTKTLHADGMEALFRAQLFPRRSSQQESVLYVYANIKGFIIQFFECKMFRSSVVFAFEDEGHTSPFVIVFKPTE